MFSHLSFSACCTVQLVATLRLPRPSKSDVWYVASASVTVWLNRFFFDCLAMSEASCTCGGRGVQKCFPHRLGSCYESFRGQLPVLNLFLTHRGHPPKCQVPSASHRPCIQGRASEIHRRRWRRPSNPARVLFRGLMQHVTLHLFSACS